MDKIRRRIQQPNIYRRMFGKQLFGGEFDYRRSAAWGLATVAAAYLYSYGVLAGVKLYVDLVHDVVL